MDEKSKDILYMQLLEMQEANEKVNAQNLISREEFMSLSARDALRYVFNYRDKETNFGNDLYFIELPDMNLEGQDLRGLYISDFYISTNDGINRIPSSINLRNTNAIINLTNIGFSEQSEDLGIKHGVIDFEKVDFRGCELYGILIDEYETESKRKTDSTITVKNKHNLDERYLKKREKHHLDDDEKKIADRAFERLLKGRALKGMVGINDYIDLTDYDLTRVPNISDAYEEIDDRGIEFSEGLILAYAKMHFDEMSKNIKRKILEKSFNDSDLEFLREHYNEIETKELRANVIVALTRQGDVNFGKVHFYEIENEYDRANALVTMCDYGILTFPKLHFDEINENKEKVLVALANQGELEFVKKKFQYINDINNKYLMIQKIFETEGMPFEMTIEEYKIGKFYEKMLQKVSENDMEFVKNHLYMLNDTAKSKVLATMLEKGETQFVKKYFTELGNGKVNVIIKLWQLGDIEFVDKHFDELKSDVRRKMLLSVSDTGDIRFIERHYSSLNKEDKSMLLEEMITRGVKGFFVEKHFSDISNKLEVFTKICEQGDFEFVKKHYCEIQDLYEKEKILLALSNQGEKDFVEENVDELIKGKSVCHQISTLNRFKESSIDVARKKKEILGALTKEEFLSKEYKGVRSYETLLYKLMFSADLELEDKMYIIGLESFKQIDSVDKLKIQYRKDVFGNWKIEKVSKNKVFYKIIDEALKQGKIEELKSNFHNFEYGKDKIIDTCLGNNDVEFVKQHFNELSDVKQSDIAEILAKKGDMIFAEAHAKEVVDNVEEPKVIQDGEKNNDSRSNKILVTEFLVNQVKLDETQINELENNFSGNTRDLYTMSVERLEMQKAILDVCNATKQAFSDSWQVLTHSPEELYARLMFFRENKIVINPEKIRTTMGISNRGFLENFGEKLIARENMNEREYQRKVKDELLKKYPMPQTIANLRSSLDELKEER